MDEIHNLSKRINFYKLILYFKRKSCPNDLISFKGPLFVNKKNKGRLFYFTNKQNKNKNNLNQI